jgi:ABC-2 type transport system permease protein
VTTTAGPLREPGAPVTAQQAAAGLDAVVPSLAARARDVLAFEWTKLRAVRSNLWTLLAASAVTIGSSAVVAEATAGAPAAPSSAVITPLTASFLGYAEYSVIPVSILAVLAFTSEYSSGLIRTTFAAVPQRLAVLAAKAAVIAGAALVAGEVLTFAVFFLTQAIMAGHHRGLSLSAPGAPRAVLAAGTLLAVCALVGLSFGAITRHTAGAIAATLGAIYLLAAACLALPSPWNLRVGKFTLPFAAYQVITQHPQPGLLSPLLSVLVMLAWPAAALVVAGLLLIRRDA